MMSRFSNYAYSLIKQLFPDYAENLEWGRTSFRPAKVEGRQTSVLKDDTRLHIDAFKASPVHGKRILRVFSNINPDNLPRVWHIGEPFTEVVARFKPLIPKYSNMLAKLQVILKLTKTKRSLYDHMMLSLHDQMKKDEQYKAQVKKIYFLLCNLIKNNGKILQTIPGIDAVGAALLIIEMGVDMEHVSSVVLGQVCALEITKVQAKGKAEKHQKARSNYVIYYVKQQMPHQKPSANLNTNISLL